MSIQCKIHGVIHYLVWMGKTPVEAYNEVKTAYGDKAMNRVFKWCDKFKNIVCLCMMIRGAEL